MGAWATCIFGNDTTLDYVYVISDVICGVKAAAGDESMASYPNSMSAVYAKALRDALNANVDAINNHDDNIDDEFTRAWAVLVLATGAKMTDEMRKWFIAGCCYDEWALDDTLRKQHTDELKQAITAYNGTPTFLAQHN